MRGQFILQLLIVVTCACAGAYAGGCGGGRGASTAPPGPLIVAAPEQPPTDVSVACGSLLTSLDKLIACQPVELQTGRQRAAELQAFRDRMRIDATAAAAPSVEEADRTATARACSVADQAISIAIADCQP